MEESKASVVATAASSVPPSTTATDTTHPPSAATNTLTKKRPLESDNGNAHSNYFKIRSVIRNLRPHFVEVLRTPDFKNSKASQEIREQIKVIVKLYENIKADAASLGKSKPDGQPNMEQQPQHVKSSEQSFARSSETKPQAPGLQKMQADDGQGTYVVGGSAFGWNFITFSGKDAVYYGRTKEEFRTASIVSAENPQQV